MGNCRQQQHLWSFYDYCHSALWKRNPSAVQKVKSMEEFYLHVLHCEHILSFTEVILIAKNLQLNGLFNLILCVLTQKQIPFQCKCLVNYNLLVLYLKS